MKQNVGVLPGWLYLTQPPSLKEEKEYQLHWQHSGISKAENNFLQQWGTATGEHDRGSSRQRFNVGDNRVKGEKDMTDYLNCIEATPEPETVAKILVMVANRVMKRPYYERRNLLGEPRWAEILDGFYQQTGRQWKATREATQRLYDILLAHASGLCRDLGNDITLKAVSDEGEADIDWKEHEDLLFMANLKANDRLREKSTSDNVRVFNKQRWARLIRGDKMIPGEGHICSVEEEKEKFWSEYSAADSTEEREIDIDERMKAKHERLCSMQFEEENDTDVLAELQRYEHKRPIKETKGPLKTEKQWLQKNLKETFAKTPGEDQERVGQLQR